MYEIVIVFFLLVAIAIVALILVQQGKGAGMGASFGAGASNTVFGSAGSGNFLTKSTWILGVVFFAICLFIGWMQKDRTPVNNTFDDLTVQQTQTSDKKEQPVVNEKSLTDAPSLNVNSNDGKTK